MSFGLEVWDEDGESVFSVGSKYIKIVGAHTSPAAATPNLTTTFTIPSTVPAGETIFITSNNDSPPLYYTLTGRTVTITHRHSGSGSSMQRQAASIFYGFYA